MSILQVLPHNSTLYYDEDEDLGTRDMIIKVKNDFRAISDQIDIHNSSTLDPSTLCFVTLRPSWNEKYSTSSLFIISFSALCALLQLYIAYWLYFSDGMNERVITSNYSILSRGFQSETKHRLFRNICMIGYAFWNYPMLMGNLNLMMWQFYILKPLPPDLFAVPILSGMVLLMDWTSIIASQFAGLVVISECAIDYEVVDGKSITVEGTAIDILQTLATICILSTIRLQVASSIMPLTSTLTGNDQLHRELLKLLSKYQLSDDERSNILTTAKVRRKWHLLISILWLLCVGAMIFLLNNQYRPWS